MAKARKKMRYMKHLWKATVYHRDWLATMSSLDKKPRMKTTQLYIVVEQVEGAKESIDLALSRTSSLLKRNQRMYGMATIREIYYDGYIDN